VRVYFAARYSKRKKLRRYRKELERVGHSVTSRWLDEGAEETAATATRDLDDIKSADLLILFSEQPRCRTRGGRFVEAGYALGLGRRVIAVGGVENIFGHLLQHFETWGQCLSALSHVSLRHVWAQVL
jgi:nucleoside 2-deoxyribosyltransferase